MPLMSQRAYARHRLELGLPGGTHKAVQKALDRGRISANADGQIDSDQADRLWVANTNESRRRDGQQRGPFPAAQDAAPGGVSYAQANAIEKAYKAKLARLEYEERVGKLVPVDEVREKWAQIVVLTRNRVLGLPSKIKARIPSVSRSDVLVIEALVREVLEEIADGDAGGSPPA